MAENEKPRAEKVVTGEVKTKKKNKLTDVFISEDVNNVKEHVFMEILVPSIKKALSDIVKDAIDMILYGESGRSRGRGTNASYVSYDRFSARRDEPRDNRMRASRTAYSYDEIIFNSRADVEEVLTGLDEIISQYGYARVADLYDLAGITSNNYTDNNYGWMNLVSAEPARVRDGWVLRLPKAVSIDRR